MDKQYIGDGVYVEWVEPHLVLTTETGLAVTNTIYLEREVWDALHDYVTRLIKKQKEETK